MHIHAMLSACCGVQASSVVLLQLWEGCACLRVISWTGILWHHMHEKQTPFLPVHADPGHFHFHVTQWGNSVTQTA